MPTEPSQQADHRLEQALCEEPLLLHSEVSRAWNDDHLAAMLAQVPPADTSTPFERISAVAPGMTVEFTPQGMREFREPIEPCEDVSGFTDAQLAARFRDLLEDSVYRATRNATRIGMSISSGLDAASIAAAHFAHRDGSFRFNVTGFY